MTHRRGSRSGPRSRLPAGLLALTLAILAAGCATAPTAAPSPSPTPTTSAPPTGTPAPTPTPTPAPPTPTPSPTPTPAPSFASYVVVPGDTLLSIARRFETSWQSLVFWNRDRIRSLNPRDPSYDPDLLVVGWQLLVAPGVVVDYDPEKDRATPTPAATPTGPTPSPGGPSTLLEHGPRTGNRIALTFDMGGRVEPAVDIVTWLIDHDIPATIFLTGAIVDSTQTDAGRTVLGLIDENRGLLLLGNHSYSHTDFRTLTAAQIRTELARAEAAYAPYTPVSPRPWFRPPEGGVDADVLAAVGAFGYGYTVTWDVDPIDWKPTTDGGPTADDIVARVVSGAQGGSVVLMHLGGYHTLEALPRIVSELAAKGYRFVTLAELVAS